MPLKYSGQTILRTVRTAFVTGNLKRAAVVAGVSSLLGLLGLFLLVDKRLFALETYASLTWQPRLALLTLLAWTGTWLFPALRIKLLSHVQGLTLSTRRAVLVQVTAAFGSAISPGKSGFGVATVAALRQAGLAPGKGITISVEQAFLDLTFYSWSVPLGLCYLVLSNRFTLPVSMQVSALGLSAALIVVAIFAHRFTGAGTRLLVWMARRRALKRFRRTLISAARDYQRGISNSKNLSLSKRLALNGLTALGQISNYVIFWALLSLYGGGLDVLSVLALLNLISVSANIVPTPGGSGFLELSVGYGAVALSASDVTAALLFWRLTTYYWLFLAGPLASWLLFRMPQARSSADLSAELTTEPAARSRGEV